MDCSICYQEVNQDDREPRELSCGHAVCNICVVSLRESGLFSGRRTECPHCPASDEEVEAAEEEEEALEEEAHEA
jgi:hypothetical protein